MVVSPKTLALARAVLQLWMLPGLFIYLVERIARWLWPAVNPTQLVDVQLMPGTDRVICLRVTKPFSFRYRRACECLQPA